jgi:hypothetical protein
MSETNTLGQTTQSDHLRNYVATQLSNGTDVDTVVAELGKSGIQEDMARRLVESVSQAPMSAAIHPQGGTPPIQGALIGGALAALVGGLVWGGLVILTGFEFGIVAWLLGGAVGYAVLMFSKGETGFPQQIAAVVFSIGGILLGKYLTFYYFVKEVVSQELGAVTAENISLFSAGLIGEFLGGLGDVVGLFDLLWIGLAVGSAWKITSSSE